VRFQNTFSVFWLLSNFGRKMKFHPNSLNLFLHLVKVYLWQYTDLRFFFYIELSKPIIITIFTLNQNSSIFKLGVLNLTVFGVMSWKVAVCRGLYKL